MTLPDAAERDGATTHPAASENATSPSPYREGEVVAGKYRLTKILGRGGMGAVWLAHNQALHADVALKLIRADVASAHTAERLLREARATARLKHPSIVRVHDFGESERGDPFIVMEVLEGEAVDVLLDRRGSLPAIRAVQLVLPIVSALAEAHEHGIVHRDIKPENIILVTDRQGTIVPKVLDFGIAKVERAKVISGEISGTPTGLAVHELQRRLTNLGTLVGSPDYMSPEQGRGDLSVDGRADIWGICVVLYELIAGRRPFLGKDVQDVLINLMVEDPPSFAELGVADEALWQIVAKGLEKRREDRWQAARDLGEALALWLLDAGVETDVAGASLRAQWLIDDPTTGRTSIDSLHLDPLTVSTSQPGVTLTEPDEPLAESTRMRRALYGVVGTIMLVLGMGIALVVIEPGETRPDSPVTGVTGAETSLPSGPPPAPEVSEAEPEVEEIGATEERADAAREDPAATATVASVVVPPRPAPRPKAPTPPPPPKSGKPGLPLPPEKPDF